MLWVAGWCCLREARNDAVGGDAGGAGSATMVLAGAVCEEVLGRKVRRRCVKDWKGSVALGGGERKGFISAGRWWEEGVHACWEWEVLAAARLGVGFESRERRVNVRVGG